MVLTISLVTGSLLLSNEVTTSTMASWSFGNLSNSCERKINIFFFFFFLLLISHVWNAWIQSLNARVGTCFALHAWADLSAVGAAVLDDPLHLLMNQLHTSKTGIFQTFDLSFHQQLKRHLRHKQRRSRALLRTTWPPVQESCKFKEEFFFFFLGYRHSSYPP